MMDSLSNEEKEKLVQMQIRTLTPEGNGSGSEDGFVQVLVGSDDGDAVSEKDTNIQEDIDKEKPMTIVEKENDGNTNTNSDGDMSTAAKKQYTPPGKDLSGKPDDENDKAGANPDSPRPTTPCVHTLIFDNDADSLLVIGSHDPLYNDKVKYHFWASSERLAAASPVWKDLISTTETSTSEKNVTMALSLTDDFDTLVYFLEIIHRRDPVLPDALTFQEMYNLARFSEKYQVHEIFMPFVEKWIEPLFTEELGPDRVEWVLIAWEFCLAGVFEDWVEHFCRHAEVNGNGCFYRERRIGELFPKGYGEKYEDCIRDKRKELMSGLISACHAGLHRSSCIANNGKSIYRAQCNAMNVGYFIKGVREAGLGEWPFEGSGISISANSFKECLMNLKFDPLPVTVDGGEERYEIRYKKGEDHSMCGVWVIRHEVAAYPLDPNFRVKDERFTKERRDREMGLFPGWMRLGFLKEDFSGENEDDSDYEDEDDEDEDCGDGDDDGYHEPEYGTEWEPAEEYDSEALESDSNAEDEDGEIGTVPIKVECELRDFTQR